MTKYHSKLKGKKSEVFSDYLAGKTNSYMSRKFGVSKAYICVINQFAKHLLGLPGKNKYYFVSIPAKHQEWVEFIKIHLDN